MQHLGMHTQRILLALSLLFFMEPFVQGFPSRRARFHWVRCRPNSLSANCIEEKGPWFNMPEGEDNRIIDPPVDPYQMQKPQNKVKKLPFSEEDPWSISGVGLDTGSGSGSGSFPEMETEPIDEEDFYNFRPSEDENVGQEITGEELII
ncbi:serglycin [Dromiciops gliroides]|uniref:serglycin n=1 Tax=Dromiciops gliroides TaxID=33562 RepID=UPI001CC52AD5|nr:serglycin [Dromiciops gliroides]